MLNFSRSKITIILLICTLFVWLAIPNVLPRDAETDKAPSYLQWMDGDRINLGLDLRGGSQLLLELDFSSYKKDVYENLRGDVRSALREKKLPYRNLSAVQGAVSFSLIPEKMKEDISLLAFIKSIDNGLDYEEMDENSVRVFYTENALQRKKVQLLEQSIEIVNRRVNETGLTEPTIQRQGDNRILLQVPGLDNPARLKAILGKTAKMSFHMVNADVDPLATKTSQVPMGTRILPADDSNRGEGYPKEYAVYSRVEIGGEALTNAAMTYDSGQPVVSFNFNRQGAKRFGDITRNNIGKPFAIVLDGKVITAPVIRGPILGGSGIITGRFDAQEAADLALLLRAGALPAPLKVVEERTVGPSLGADSIAAGKAAAVVAVAAVMVFMFLSYGLFGIFSNIGLAINLIMLMGALSFFQATLTLPGIAGIVLTLGMAVDANVLIFERIREEVARGRSAMASLEAGFKAAFGTIVDSNITTLIAAFVLYYFGTGTIRGFAITLSIGIVASMFSAILLTRLMVVLWAKKRRPQVIPI